MESERKSSIHEIRGGHEEWRKDAQKKYEVEFASKKRIGQMERKKSPEELKVIHAVVTMVNEYLAQYGAKPLKITAHHVHILDGARMDEETRRKAEGPYNRSGGYIQLFQSIVIPDWKFASELEFAHTLAHELIHFCSYNGSAKIEGEAVPRSHRVGLG
jgi:hypothetical protein